MDSLTEEEKLVKTGATWAKWIGIVFGIPGAIMAVAMLVVVSLSPSGWLPSNLTSWQVLLCAVALTYGIVFWRLSKKLLNPSRRRSSQFIPLIVLTGINFSMGIINWFVEIAKQAPQSSFIIMLLAAWALYVLIKGRKALRIIEIGGCRLKTEVEAETL